VRDIGRLGLTARIDPSGVFARVTGSVGRFEHAFGARVDSTFSNDPNVIVYTVHGNRSLPMPRELRQRSILFASQKVLPRVAG